MDSNQVLTELKVWLDKGIKSVKELNNDASKIGYESEILRLNEKYLTMKMMLNKINELEQQFL